MGEQLDPEALREVMQRYFDAMRVAIERHEGTVEKFIGDAVMAVFGIPQIHEDDALRAVRAAFDMLAALGTLNRDIKSRWGVELAIRTGINTGEVVAGDATIGQALATGDVVNTAASLEQAEAAGIETDDSPEEATARLRALVGGSPQGELIAKRVAGAIGLATDDSAAAGGQETFWAIRRLFEAMARRRPLVAVFDDVQWGTP